MRPGHSATRRLAAGILPSVATQPLTEVQVALDKLLAALQDTGVRLDLNGSVEADQVKVELQDQIQDYLLPRLRRLDAPLLAVLGGSTGSGKSTITNSLVGETVSPSGVLRPTTRSPVLICHPDDAPWFQSTDLLPNLARVTSTTPTGDNKPASGIDALRICPTDLISKGLAIVDAPDIDSVEIANRDLATQLLAAADLWLFVTTAVRYADAVPWDFLGRAKERGTSLCIVINRVPKGAGVEILPHFTSMLDKRGLNDIEVFGIEQVELDDDGLLPDASLSEMQAMLSDLATDSQKRSDIVRSTLVGALKSVGPRAEVVHQALLYQDQATDSIRMGMEDVYRSTKEQLAMEIADGSLLHGEVLDRWQELIGTAELMRAIQSRITRVRGRIGNFVKGKQETTLEVQGEITSSLEQIVIDHADAAALAVTERWRQLPGGLQALDNNASLERHSSELKSAIAGEIRDWQGDILDLVRQRGEGKRSVARALALGVNGVGVALMVVLFAHTGGLTGGEVAVASGTAAVSQTLLNALFGEQAVRDLTQAARLLLQERLEKLLDLDANRFRAHLWSQVPDPTKTPAVATALNELQVAATQIELPTGPA